MNLRPIVLSVKRGAFRSDTPAPPGSDAIYRSQRLVVLKRDDSTCQFCGFRHAKNEVHHVNDNHEDHSVENLVTACVLCHMSHHLAYAGTQNRGSMIYLPGTPIGQGPLNQLVRTLWITEALAKGDLKNTATLLLARLERAELYAAQKIGTANPSVLGDFLASMNDQTYEQRAKALEGIYLLPKKSAYGAQLKLWIAENQKFSPTEWVKKAEEKFAQWA